MWSTLKSKFTAAKLVVRTWHRNLNDFWRLWFMVLWYCVLVIAAIFAAVFIFSVAVMLGEAAVLVLVFLGFVTVLAGLAYGFSH